MSEYRRGILRFSESWFADHFANYREIITQPALEAAKLINLPKWFDIANATWDWDTGELKIKLDSFYLPICHKGEMLPDLEIVWKDNVATHVLVRKRVVIHTDTIEVPLSAP